jgi:hypothetical protein
MYRKSGWGEISKANLANACMMKPNSVQTWSSELAHDVVFFFVEKPS